MNRRLHVLAGNPMPMAAVARGAISCNGPVGLTNCRPQRVDMLRRSFPVFWTNAETLETLRLGLHGCDPVAKAFGPSDACVG
jgi:hypothetical protein